MPLPPHVIFSNDELEVAKEVEYFPASRLFEYRWPFGDDTAEMYFLQEQVAEFLGIRGIQRKYPGTCTCMYREYML